MDREVVEDAIATLRRILEACERGELEMPHPRDRRVRARLEGAIAALKALLDRSEAEE